MAVPLMVAKVMRANYKAGINGSRWAASIPMVELAAASELPYADAGGVEVNEETAAAFGIDLASTIMGYLKGIGESGR